MPITTIDTVAIVVSDKRKAIKWHTETLRLPLAYVGPPVPSSDPKIQGTPENPGHWVEIGQKRPLTRIHLCEIIDHGTEPGPTGITLLTDDIISDHDRLVRAGVKFLQPPQKMEWGEWLCQFVDPDGNEFDLKQPAEDLGVT